MVVTCPHCRRALDGWLTALAAGRVVIGENVEILVTDVQTGDRWSERRHNLVTDRGLTLIGEILDGLQPQLTQGAVGTSGVAPAPSDTALGAEVYRAQIAQTAHSPQTAVRRLFVPTSAANGQTLREAGLFNGNNVMLTRVTHTDIVKTASLTVTYSWTHTMARG